MISKCMHGLQECLFRYITVAVFHIYAQRGEDAAKKGVWRSCIKLSWILHFCSWKIMEKSWNSVFDFLWEPCSVKILYQVKR